VTEGNIQRHDPDRTANSVQKISVLPHK
jgi:hypothetical protein